MLKPIDVSFLNQDGYNWSEGLLLDEKARKCPGLFIYKMAEPTGFEPATSDVTGRRSNQLNYDSALKLSRLASTSIVVGGTGFEPVAPSLRATEPINP